MYDIISSVFTDNDYINKKIGPIFKLLIVIMSGRWKGFPLLFFLIFPVWIIPILWPKVLLLKLKMNESWGRWGRKEGKQASRYLAKEEIKRTISEVGCQKVLGSDCSYPELSWALYYRGLEQNWTYNDNNSV